MRPATVRRQPRAFRRRAPDLAGFSNETRTVLGALAKRIERENSELYPLADNPG